MEWQIITVIITVVGFGITVIKPILELNSSIVKLTEAVKSLEIMQTDNKGAIKDAQDKLDDHEHRITVLENKP